MRDLFDERRRAVRPEQAAVDEHIAVVAVAAVRAGQRQMALVVALVLLLDVPFGWL